MIEAAMIRNEPNNKSRAAMLDRYGRLIGLGEAAA
jgi:hypothetical protein